MRVWLLRGEADSEAEALGPLLRQWSARPENAAWSLECLPLTADLASAVRARQPEVLVLAEPACPAGPWAAEVLALGPALVVATTPERAAPYAALAEQYPVHLLPLPASADGLGLALGSGLASLRRLQCWKARVEQLQQRLADRIIIERAKGILVHRLGISEKEAYKRLRVLSRRQRRQIRDIAQSLLDTQSLLSPEQNGFGDLSRPCEGRHADRSAEPS
jgi:AmiR/NasT family two-component response regulator